MFGGYFVAVARPTWEIVLCSVVALSCFALLWWGGGAPYGARDALISVLALAIIVGLGRAGRLRVDLANARAEAAEEAARRRSSEERLRIARELHDIIGHSLGTIAVQAGVGRHLMETDPRKPRTHWTTLPRSAWNPSTRCARWSPHYAMTSRPTTRPSGWPI
jgi:signal transduction histidine kinase